MTNQETNVANVAITTLSSSMGATDLTASVVSTADFPPSPCYAVIDPDDDTKREIILFDGTFTGTSLVTTVLGNRYLAGSAAGSGITHDVDAKVIISAGLAQLWQDINDRVDNADTNISANAAGIASNDTDIGTLQTQSNERTPVGVVEMYAGASAPTKWLMCDGAAVSRTTYANLYAVVGDTFGAGDGSATFNLPDLREKFPVGAVAGGDYDLADTGGAASVTLTTTQMPGHTHTGPSHTHSGPSHTHSGPSHTHAEGSLATGSGGAHAHTILARSTNTSSHNHASDAGDRFATFPVGGTTSDSNRASQSAGSHTHNIAGSTAASGTGNTGAGGTGNTGASGTGATGSTGGGSSHENRPPFLALNFIIFAGA